MNSNQRIPIILCIAFGICLGQMLLELSGMTVRTLISPLVNGILGTVFNGMDSKYLQIGSFISGVIGIGVNVVILWFVWQRFAEPLIKKDTTPNP